MLGQIKKQFGQLVKATQGESFTQEPESTENLESLLRRPPVPLKPTTPQLRKNEIKGNEQVILDLESSYKSNYTHGFETIYSLENVDITTVRRISQNTNQIEKQVTPPSQKKSPLYNEDPQMELDLGVGYRNWMHSWVLREPIQMLGLSAQAERALLDADKHEIKQIYKLSRQELSQIKGIGHGHIDEILQKLESYLQEREIEQCRQLDSDCLLRNLLVGIDRIKVHAYLEPFNLAELIPLSTSEIMAWRRLTEEKRHELASYVYETLQLPQRKACADAAIEEVVQVFIKPWMRCRFGIATLEEINERLERVSSNQEITSRMLLLLSATYPSTTDWIPSLYTAEKGIFCVDTPTLNAYRITLEMANTYFYNAEVSYRLKDLIGMMDEELSRKWARLPIEFMIKTLRVSPLFITRKDNEGHLRIMKIIASR